MRSKVIVDCERDCKGAHKWVRVGIIVHNEILWCSECGALGKQGTDILISGRRPFPVVSRRVKEPISH